MTLARHLPFPTTALATSLALCLCLGCAEPPRPASGPKPVQAPRPALDAASAARLDDQWRAIKARRWSRLLTDPKAEELAVGCRAALADEGARAAVEGLYAHRLHTPVFFEGGALTAQAWTHGIARPEGWPPVDDALAALDAIDREARATAEGGLGEEALAGFEGGEVDLSAPLDAATLPQSAQDELRRLDRLAVDRRGAVAALDAALVQGIWALDEALRLPLPDAQFGNWWRLRARKQLTEWRAQNPVAVWPAENLDRVAPHHEDYARLRAALARYTALARAGALAPPPDDLPAGLALGDRHPGLVAVRRRLVAEGFGPLVVEDEALDGALSAQLRRFQQTRGLTGTGALDADTLKALSVPAEALVGRLRLGLVRWHRSLTRMSGEYVRVNLPEFKVQIVEGSQVFERLDAVVGAPWSPTPRFDGVIYRLEAHPWWWGVRNNPKKVPPGPQNPLGALVLRVLPHHPLIFLHGTNQPELLDRDERALSHGCIRLKDPQRIAEHLIAREQGAEGVEILQRALDSKRQTRKIDLKTPIPVFFEYNTTFVHPDTDLVHFAPDIYRDDQALPKPPAVDPW